jgi:hypothetical protein
VPLHGAPPTDTAQIGHGWFGSPVSTVAELRLKTHEAAPVAVFSVPVGPAQVPVPAPVQHANGIPAPVQFALGQKVFVTHTESPAFTIGSGVPNLQPAAVQSIPAGVDPDAVVPRLQFGPTHDSVKRLTAPGGVALSGTPDRPPPIERLPQSRFFNGLVPPTSRNVWPQKPTPAVDVKSKPDGPPPIVVLVDDVVATVELDDVVGAAVELDDVVGAAVELDDVVGAAVELDDVVGAAVELDDVVGAAVELDDVVGAAVELDDVVGAAVELDELLVDELDEDDVELDDVVVVGGLATAFVRSSTQSSTSPWRVVELPVGGPQSFPALFSSL